MNNELIYTLVFIAILIVMWVTIPNPNVKHRMLDDDFMVFKRPRNVDGKKLVDVTIIRKPSNKADRVNLINWYADKMFILEGCYKGFTRAKAVAHKLKEEA